MSAPTISRVAVVDGEQVPLTECDWLQFAPCGCPCAVAMAELRNSDHVIASLEQAEVEFTGTQTKAEAKRDRDAGFAVRLITHDAFRAMDNFGKCPHEPKWGVAPDPTPAGFAWARDGFGGKYRHLVADDHVADSSYDPETHKRRDYPRTTAGGTLCEPLRKFGCWHSDGHLHSDTMACLKCLRAATAMQLPAPVGGGAS